MNQRVTLSQTSESVQCSKRRQMNRKRVSTHTANRNIKKDTGNAEDPKPAQEKTHTRV